MEDIQGKVFSDFEPPSTTDGSYRGGVKHKKATEQHYKMKFNQALVQTNQRLKASKAKVSIECLGDALQLRATLPLKPNDTHPQGKANKQYKISLGIPANFDGLKTAEEEAYELGKLIARKTFIWTDKYLGVQATKNNDITYDEFYEQLETRFYEKRKKTIKSENYFYSFSSSFRRHFTGKEVISVATIKKRINLVGEPYTRNKLVMLGCFIAKQLNFDCTFNDLKLKAIPRTRDIPDDNEIIHNYSRFDKYFSELPLKRKQSVYKNELHKLIYILMATYGLRPREILNNPDIRWFVSDKNLNRTFKVHESNKTGYREAIPFVPEWLDLLNLESKPLMLEVWEKACNWNKVELLTARVTEISKYFIKVGIPFTPYDLRHACAIRAHIKGIPVKAASDNLGHSVEMHTKTYQRWFGFENRLLVFNKSLDDVNEIDALKDENSRLRKRVAELEVELSRRNLEDLV